MKSEVDTENFDKFEEEEPWIHNINKKKRKDGNFVGFTYNRNDENVKSSLLAALLDLEALKPSNTSEKKIVKYFFLFNLFIIG